MNRIGWFVVCLVVASAAQSSPSNGTLMENRGELKNITRLMPVTEKLDPDVLEIRNFFHDLFDGDTAIQGRQNEGRTFGQKRIQFMMMAPMMYKMGVMMTMLAVVTVISLKGLLIGLILLILKISGFLAKLYVSWQAQGHGHPWPHHQQPVHVHVHGNGYQSHNQPYNAWQPENGPSVDTDQHYYYKR